MSKKTFSKEFKLQVVQQLQTGKSVEQVARDNDLKQELVWAWRRAYNKDPVNAFAGKGNAASMETRNAELERKIGQLYLQVEFLKKVNADLQALLVQSKKNGK